MEMTPVVSVIKVSGCDKSAGGFGDTDAPSSLIHDIGAKRESPSTEPFCLSQPAESMKL
jgi:hypothetical protein